MCAELLGVPAQLNTLTHLELYIYSTKLPRQLENDLVEFKIPSEIL